MTLFVSGSVMSSLANIMSMRILCGSLLQLCDLLIGVVFCVLLSGLVCLFPLISHAFAALFFHVHLRALSSALFVLFQALCLSFSRQLPIGHVFSTDGSRCQAPQVYNQGGCRCLSVLLTSCSARFGRTGTLGCGGSASGLTLTIGTGSLT